MFEVIAEQRIKPQIAPNNFTNSFVARVCVDLKLEIAFGRR